MATFHFELVSPDKISFSGEVDQVDVPGAEGDFGVLAGHAPLIALLRPGIMTVYAGGEQTRLVVLGGFAEVGPGRPDRAGRCRDLGRGLRPRCAAGADRARWSRTSRRWPKAPRSTSAITGSITSRRSISTCKAPRCTDGVVPGIARHHAGRARAPAFRSVSAGFWRGTTSRISQTPSPPARRSRA